jgi:hypothetical protein
MKDQAPDFSHSAMHNMADWPVLARMVLASKSRTKRLDSRAVTAIYRRAGSEDWASMSDAENKFALAAIEAYFTA